MTRSLARIEIKDEKHLPKYPRIDLSTGQILDAPPNGQPFPEPSPEELDQVLLNEAEQRNDLCGLQLAELALFHDMEPFGPDLPGSEPHELIVDESTWIAVLKRDHWVKFNRRVPKQNFMWDPADDRVWNVLRVINELANRMVLAAADHKWLLSMTHLDAFQMIRNVAPGGELGNYEKEKKLVDVSRMREVDAGSREAVMEVLDGILGVTTMMTIDSSKGVWARTTTSLNQLPMMGERVRNFVMIWDESIEALFRPDAYTQEQLNHVRWVVARTICHELMHALSNAITLEIRKHLEIPRDKWTASNGTELFYNDQQWAECGQSFSLDVFSSETQYLNEPKGLLPGQVFYGEAEPNPGQAMKTMLYSYLPPNFTTAYHNRHYHCPALWVNAHFREDFWTWIRQNGNWALRTPDLAISASYQDELGLDRVYRARLNRNAVIEAPLDVSAKLRRIADNIIELRREVHQLRKPWYRTALARWQATPYSEVLRRTQIDELADAFQRPFLQSEYKASCIVERLKDPEVSGHGIVTWFYHAIGLMGEAALPSRMASIDVEPGQPCDQYKNLWDFTSHNRRPLKRNFPVVNGRLSMDRHSCLNEACSGKILNPHLKGDAPSARQLWTLDEAKVYFDKWAIAAVLPLGIVAEFYRTWRSLRVSIERTALSDQWHNFDFRLPPYQGILSQDFELDVFYTSEEYDPSVIDSEEGIDAQAMMARVTEVAKWDRYVSIGELGDHQYNISGATTIWGLRRCLDREEVAVYDISPVVKGLPGAMTYMDLLEPASSSNEVGMFIRDTLPNPFAEQINKLEPISLLALERKREDVHINRNAKDRWMLIGHNVYDVTACLKDIDVNPELKKSIERSVGQNPAIQLCRQGMLSSTIFSDLAAHKIGFVRDEVEYIGPKGRIFTEQDLAWHSDEETGYYVAVGGDVYDITDYREVHPGGKVALERLAGKDITDIWTQAHGMGDSLANQRLMPLCVGRLVPRHFSDFVVPQHCICIRNVIYDMRPIRDSPDPRVNRFFDLSYHWRGRPSQVVTDTLYGVWGEIPDNLIELNALLNTPEWRYDTVVSKEEPKVEELPIMTKSQLSKYDGSHEEWEEDLSNTFAEGFIAVERFVYNVLTLTKTCTGLQREHLQANMGRRMKEPKWMCEWLKDEHSHRIIARYSAHALPSQIDVYQWKFATRTCAELDPAHASEWNPLVERMNQPLSRVDPTDLVITPIGTPGPNTLNLSLLQGFNAMSYENSEPEPSKRRPPVTDDRKHKVPRLDLSPRVEGLKGYMKLDKPVPPLIQKMLHKNPGGSGGAVGGRGSAVQAAPLFEVGPPLVFPSRPPSQPQPSGRLGSPSQPGPSAQKPQPTNQKGQQSQQNKQKRKRQE